MSQLHSQHSLEPGLFTFYISQNKQHQNYQIIYPLKQSNNNYSFHGRNQQNISHLYNLPINELQNTDNQSDRTQKLNKFLSNCVGYRRNKSIDNFKSKQEETSHIRQEQIKKQKDQNKKKRQSKLKYVESEIIGTKKVLQVKRLNINEDIIQQRKLVKRRHTNKQQYLRINHHSPLQKLKQNKAYIKLNTRQKELQQEQKMIQENINDIKQYFKRYQQLNAGHPKNKIIQLKLLTHLYPRLIKHHSQQLFIHPSKNSMNVRSLVSKNSDNCYHINKDKSDSQFKQQKYYNIQKQAYKIKNQINILQNLDKKVCIQTQKKKQNKLKINNLQNRQQNTRSSMLSAQNCRQMFMVNDMGSKNKQNEKRNNRLQLIYKNKKNTINLPPLNLAQRNIQKQNHINEIYYSVDHRQKKPLQINVGVFPNNRLIEGWQQRKKALIQKINFKDEKKIIKIEKNQINTRKSNKNDNKPNSKNKQNRIETKENRK